MDTEIVHPGINKQAILSQFSKEEFNIISLFAKEWRVTFGGEPIESGSTSQYKFFLIKPTRDYQELFNIKREIVVVFSDYSPFQPRSLDAFEAAFEQLNPLRVEKIATVLISRDKNIIAGVSALLRSDSERQIIVPFSYGEFQEKHDAYFIKNRFMDHFFSRDLFNFQSPLKKDIYFFGRNDIVQDIVSRTKANENSGLFGLRKSGKTSIVFGVERVLIRERIASIFIDCQSPSFHQKRWNDALGNVTQQIANKYFSDNQKTRKLLASTEQYHDPSRAPELFEHDLLTFYKKTQKKPILIIFDEIEHISPVSSPSGHWINENDFVLFWQTLRSVYQKHQEKMSYLISGTNPQCVELPQINGIDNPIFNQIPATYIPAFSVSQTKNMIDTLGRLMGLIFDDIVISCLTDDFGGHPFLIRLVCSRIHLMCHTKRPIRIDKIMYEKAKQQMLLECEPYIEMILHILKKHYSIEYDMLKMLALEDFDNFNELSIMEPSLTKHLLAYQIIDKNDDKYFFKIEAIKHYLSTKNRFEKKLSTDKERYHEISERRNNLEKSLRSMVRKVLFSSQGEVEAKNIVIGIIKTKSIYSTFSLKELFDPNKTELYFNDLKNIIVSHWTDFEKIFPMDKAQFDQCMTVINRHRADCHAKALTDDEFNEFRIAIKKIEFCVEKYQ